MGPAPAVPPAAPAGNSTPLSSLPLPRLPPAGGIYGYPGDAKNTNGKLRLLYECAPMSMIAEQAGGKGSTGFQRVLDIVPEAVHQRVPLFCGSKWEVEYLESVLQVGLPAAVGGVLTGWLGPGLGRGWEVQ